jgi:tRNA A37 methylthiotransferase MiaB
VLVEKRSTRDAREFTGRTENMRYVNFAGDARMIGRFVDVAITEVMANSLRGRIVDAGDGDGPGQDAPGTQSTRHGAA